MLASALSVRSRRCDDLVDPGVVVAQPEVARLDAQRLAHGEERVEHQLLRHDAERAPRLPVVASRRRGPSRAALPLSARASPARMLISVVLPAPFGPSRPKNSPCSIVEARRRPGRARAEALVDLLDFDCGHGIGQACSATRGKPTAGCAHASRRGREFADAVERDQALQIVGQILEADARARCGRPRAPTRAAGHRRGIDLASRRHRSTRTSAPSNSCAPSASSGLHGGQGHRALHAMQRPPIATRSLLPDATAASAPEAGAAVLLAQRLDQPVDAALTDLVGEGAAVGGDQAHALHRHVVDLPVRSRPCPCCSRRDRLARRRAA